MYVEAGYIDDGYFGGAGSIAAFILGSASLKFERDPQRPPRSLQLIQAVGRATGGNLYGYSVHAEDDLLTLSFPRLHRYYLERLREWFRDVSAGMSHAFTYRQPDGVEITVRFAEPRLSVREITPDRFAVELSLMIES